MQGEISSREFAEWMAYYRLEPYGEERADLRNARLLAMLATVNGDGSKDYSAADFMMDFGSDGPDEVDVADIVINLKSAGRYTLTMSDSVTSQVITRERFTGKVGENKLKIYTSSLPVKYLYLLLEDESKSQIGKTTITIN